MVTPRPLFYCFGAFIIWGEPSPQNPPLSPAKKGGERKKKKHEGDKRPRFLFFFFLSRFFAFKRLPSYWRNNWQKKNLVFFYQLSPIVGRLLCTRHLFNIIGNCITGCLQRKRKGRGGAGNSHRHTLPNPCSPSPFPFSFWQQCNTIVAIMLNRGGQW